MASSDTTGGTRVLRAGGRPVEVSRPDKVFFPDDGITKGALAEYYLQVAPAMLRHMRGRPVAAERFPDGIGQQRFFQKNVPEHFPDWVRRVDVPNKEGGTTTHAVCDDEPTLVYLADQATVTPHVWLSRADELDTPDRLVFDLDPSTRDLKPLRWAAACVRDTVEELGLVPFLMTTGSRGYHVVAPLRRAHDFDTVRAFTRDLASLLAARHPERLTVEQRKDQRGDRIFLDYLRNAYGQTAVAPYALRPRPRAPAATPLRWEELDRTPPDAYTMDSVLHRLRDTGDPWSNLTNRARSLDQPHRRLAHTTHGDVG